MVQVKKAQVRDAILDAAATLFIEKGYVGTSASEIGQRAGVAPSAIYTYFDSKLDLFYQVYSPWLRARLGQLDGEVAAISGYRAKVRRIVETMWRDIPNEQNFFANNLMQAVSTATPADHYRGELLELCEKHVARLLKTAAPGPRHGSGYYANLAHLLFMSFNGFVVGAYLGVRADKTEPAIDAMTDLIVGASAPDLKPVAG